MFEKLNKYAQFRTKDILEFYCTNLLGSPPPHGGQTVLDIGGGHGIATLYSALLGAEAVLLEPELDGSSRGMIADFKRAQQELDLLEKSTHLPLTFQEFVSDPNWSERRWDIVVLSNSINHLDEDATIHVQTSQESRVRMMQNLFALSQIVKPGGRLVITDCMRRNFWADINRISPFAPSIEWHKHQDPKVWIDLLGQVGFTKFSIQWSKFRRYRFMGLPIFSNRVVAYFTDSHFRIEGTR
jgi:SAM-dependent methyltransferase